jgi:biopolymer transport protein ExbD
MLLTAERVSHSVASEVQKAEPNRSSRCLNDQAVMPRHIRISLLLLVLLLTVVDRRYLHKPKSSGILMRLPGVVSCEGDREVYVLKISKGSGWNLNSAELDSEAANARLKARFRYASESLLFLTADAEMSYQEYVDSLSRVRKANPNTYLVMLPPEALSWSAPQAAGSTYSDNRCWGIAYPRAQPQPQLLGIPD